MTDTPRLLFVDDEPELREFFSSVFNRDYRVVLAEDGEAGLEVLKREGPFAVIVSDLNMPNMDGIEFLARAQAIDADAVRLVLTGYSNEEYAIEAVNRGAIYRYLTKPVRVPTLQEAVQTAVHRNEVRRAERELLQNTLRGSIAVLTHALSLASPGIFGRVSRLRDDMLDFCRELDVGDTWELETSAMLSQIGLLVAPPGLTAKIAADRPLTREEKERYREHAGIGANLVARVPRLETVADNIRMQHKNFDGSGHPNTDERKHTDIPLGARMLRLLDDMYTELNLGRTKGEALQKLRQHPHGYDPDLLEALARSDAGHYGIDTREIPVGRIQPGAVLAGDLFNTSGALVLRAGQEITDYLAQKLRVFAEAEEIPAKLRVSVEHAGASDDNDDA